MVQEPRGKELSTKFFSNHALALDSADRLVSKFISANDKEASKLMEVICHEEIEHVRIGVKWYIAPFKYSLPSILLFS